MNNVNLSLNLPGKVFLYCYDRPLHDTFSPMVISLEHWNNNENRGLVSEHSNHISTLCDTNQSVHRRTTRSLNTSNPLTKIWPLYF